MSYLVFARKFRPQKFEEVIGQEPITATLQNAIREERIAQSFLFSGTRGVGKTSTARILARALNCETGIVAEPCGQCLSCQEIAQGSSLDVLEIDGASNRGIDEIRNLRENVKFKPAQARFKIYIIDEVHMLTQEAFNALLKTLEEPPEHVKFIFATTEAHKVPLTILSRCQKFVFRRVPTSKIVEKLKAIARLEKIKVEEEALYALARAAEGSLRDAESLLDQMASFSKGAVTYDKVVEALGIPSDETYVALTDAILEKDAKRVLGIFAPLASEGKDMAQFVRGLAEIFRGLLVLKMAGKFAREMVDLSPEVFKGLEARVDRFSKEDLLAVGYLIQNLLRDLRRSPVPELVVETALIKLAVRDQLASIGEILAKLEALGSSGERNPSPSSEEKRSAERSSSAPARQRETVLPTGEIGPSFLPGAKPVSPHQGHMAQGVLTGDPPSTGVTQGTVLTLNDVERVWAQAVEEVKAKKMSCGMFLSEASPAEVQDHLVILGLPGEFKFHKENLEKGENRKIVESVFQSLLGLPVKVSFVVTLPEKTPLARTSSDVEKEKVPEIVESAVKMFQGKIVRKS